MKKSEFAKNSDALFSPQYSHPLRFIGTSFTSLVMMILAILLAILIISKIASLSF
ncbi:MAG: hypothetical protein AABZ60_04900 [Planctomycetota bacterium]